MPTAKKTSTKKKTTKKKTTGRKVPPRVSDLPEVHNDDDDDVEPEEPAWKERCQDIEDTLHEIHTLVMGAMTTKIRMLERRISEAEARVLTLETGSKAVTERLDDCEGLLLEALPTPEEDHHPATVEEGAANEPS